MSYSEKQFIVEVLGKEWTNLTNIVDVRRAPGDRACSAAWNHIYLPKKNFDNPLGTYDGISTLTHEFFHQIQYVQGGPIISVIPLAGLGNSAWDQLGLEQIQNSTGYDVYSFGDYKKTDISIYNSLNDVPFLEAQAELVGNFALLYYNAKNGHLVNSNDIFALKKSAEILFNSNFYSEAIKWVLENY